MHVQLLEGLQWARIIHTDIKPDNLLVTWPPGLFDDSTATAAPPRWSPSTAFDRNGPWRSGCMQLIDFGRAIDLELLAPGTQFTGAALTENMQCPEMLAGKPWHYCVRILGSFGATSMHRLLAPAMRVACSYACAVCLRVI